MKRTRGKHENSDVHGEVISALQNLKKGEIVTSTEATINPDRFSRGEKMAGTATGKKYAAENPDEVRVHSVGSDKRVRFEGQ